MNSISPIMLEIKVDSEAACGQSHMRCFPKISALRQSLFTLWFSLKGARCQQHRGLLRETSGKKVLSLSANVICPHDQTLETTLCPQIRSV